MLKKLNIPAGGYSIGNSEISPQVYVHLDGSVGKRGKCGIGWAIYDLSHTIIEKRSCKLGLLSRDSTIVEMYALADALKYLSEQGIGSAVLYTDSYEMLKHLGEHIDNARAGKRNPSYVSILTEISAAITDHYVQNIANKENKVADELARKSLQY